ncbi:hypothetical protein [Actinomyces succiniciruminis]|uniref:Uncharacterized protein n=1 Tax=Actinomyces succiniciruminis TaxID=1522002 RepID=A0A1L7RA71_9ACTO|nr:hypothetical protein [Actinomyces succiniciruminis]CED90747.1 Hypothetical protein AAM4_0915 [Actinomyces succiniciruminis]
MAEGTNSSHTQWFRKLQVCAEVHAKIIGAFIALANTIITISGPHRPNVECPRLGPTYRLQNMI